MRHRLWTAAAALIVIATAGCAPVAPSAPRVPPATSFEEYAVAFCSAFDSLFRAIGNPDTGSDSELSASFDKAIEDGDLASAERLAATITTELETGRQHVAVASGWQPAAPTMAHLDRVFLAFETMIAAKLAGARHAPDAIDPQAAFEGAGGVEAWFAMFEAARVMERPGGAEHHCPTVPIGT